MTHRAGLDEVKVREKRNTKDEPRLLGDIDGSGSSLIDVIEAIANKGLRAQTDNGLKQIQCMSCATNDVGDELHLVIQNGQTGQAADIVDPKGQMRLHQRVDDSHRVRCMALFKLEPAQRRGWLAVHVNNGRGIKSLLDKGIQDAFRQRFDNLVLEITPIVLEATLRTAVEQNKIEKAS